MNRRSLSVLIVLNVVLLAAIALTLGPVPKAEAQLGGGSYLMIAGNTTQAQQQVIYVMDTRTGRVAGFTVNSANKKKSGDNAAHADQVIAQPAFTMMTARTRGGGGDDPGEESLFILDNNAGVLVVYAPNVGRKQIEPIQGIRMTDVLSGTPLTRDQARELTLLDGKDLYDLFFWANKIRTHYVGANAKFCSIVTGKVGGCSEDCSYCSQSKHYDTHVKPSRMRVEEMESAAEEALASGASSFGIVNSGRGPTDKELDWMEPFFRKAAEGGEIRPCATLGELRPDQAARLKDMGVQRINHNLETSRRHFGNVVSTHSYDDRVNTIRTAKEAGLSICSGGIFGLGEDWEDRLDMAFELKELGADVVPINFLNAIQGTPLHGKREDLEPMQALKIVAIYRFILPDRELKIAGGRETILRDMQSWMFFAGGSSFLIGNYLTTFGRTPKQDHQMLKDLGMKIHLFNEVEVEAEPEAAPGSGAGAKGNDAEANSLMSRTSLRLGLMVLLLALGIGATLMANAQSTDPSNEGLGEAEAFDTSQGAVESLVSAEKPAGLSDNPLYRVRDLFMFSPVINGIIAGLSALGLIFFLYFMLSINRRTFAPPRFVDEVVKLVIRGDYERAGDVCRRSRGVFAAGIVQRCVENHSQNHSVMLDMIDTEGRRQADIVWNRVSYLADISNIAPMLGLVGTVLGMIKAFYGLEHESGGVDAVVLSRGVGEAMATTLFGLSVGILTLVFYSLTKARATRTLAEAEQAVHMIADHIKRDDAELMVDVGLPASEQAEAGSTQALKVVITYDDQGRVYLGERPVELDQLESELAKLAEISTDQPVILRGDKEAKIGLQSRIMDAAYAVGLEDIRLSRSDAEHQQFLFAYKLLQRGEVAEAAAEFEEYLGKFPRGEKFGDAQYYRALLYRKAGQNDKAALLLKSAKAPTIVPAYAVKLLHGQILSDQGRFKEALGPLEQIKTDDLDDKVAVSALYLKGLAYRGADNLGAAATALADAAQLDTPMKARALLDLAKVRALMKDNAKALAALERCLKIEDQAITPEAARFAGDLSYNAGDYEKAINYYSTVSSRYQSSPHFAPSVVGLLWAQFADSRFDDLYKTFDNAIDALPVSDRLPAYYLAGSAYQAQARHDNAVEMLSMVAGGSGSLPIQEKVLYKLALSQFELEQYEPMRATIASLLKRFPETKLAVDVAFLQATADAKAGQVQQGAARLTQFVEQGPSSPYYQQALLRRAHLYETNAEIEPAAKDYRAYLKSVDQPTPTSLQASFRLMELLSALSKHSEVIALSTGVLQIDVPELRTPSVEQEALYRLAVAQRFSGDLDQALLTHSRLTRDHPINPYRAESLLEQGLIRMTQGDSEDGVPLLLDAVEREGLTSSAKVSALRIVAQHYADEGQTQKAFDLRVKMQQVADRDQVLTDDESLWMAEQLLARGKAKQAVMFAGAVEDEKLKDRAGLVLGRALREDGKVDEAIEVLGEVRAVSDRYSADAWLELALVYRDQGKDKLALTELAALQNPDRGHRIASRALYEAGLIHAFLFKTNTQTQAGEAHAKSAREAFKKLWLLYPDREGEDQAKRAYLALAELQQAMGDAAGEVKTLEELATAHPDSAYASYAKAMLAIRAGQAERADAYLQPKPYQPGVLVKSRRVIFGVVALVGVAAHGALGVWAWDKQIAQTPSFDDAPARPIAVKRAPLDDYIAVPPEFDPADLGPSAEDLTKQLLESEPPQLVTDPLELDIELRPLEEINDASEGALEIELPAFELDDAVLEELDTRPPAELSFGEGDGNPGVGDGSGAGSADLAGDALGSIGAAPNRTGSTMTTLIERPQLDVGPSTVSDIPPDLAPTLDAPVIDFTDLALGGTTEIEVPENLDNDFTYRVTRYDPTDWRGRLISPDEEPGYFRVDITAQRSLRKLQTMPKDVIYIIDTSSSISQKWVEQITKGVTESLVSLNEGDRFNVVLFNEKVSLLSDTGPIDATKDNTKAAGDFLSNAQSVGFTDVNAALRGLLIRDIDPRRVYELVLISDGQSTRGVLNTRDLINLITRDNDLVASIYCVGVGNRQNRELLNFLAYRNKGYSVYADKIDEASVTIQDLMSRLRFPIIKDVRLNAVGIDSETIFPADLPNIHQGETISVFGRYTKPEAFTMQLVGRSAGKGVEFTFRRDLNGAQIGDEKVANQWAFWKLHDLYSLIIREVAEDTKPLNILWLTVEDMSPWIGPYGDTTVPTPHLDKLAAEGVTYDNAFATSPVCAPARSSLITGMYCTRIGTMQMRNGKRSGTPADPEAYKDIPLYEGVPPQWLRCFPEHLRVAGYYCTNNSKTDYQFKAPVTVWDQSNRKAHWKNRAEGQPFFAVFNHNGTHESRAFPARKPTPVVVTPEDVPIPPIYPDTPAVRDAMSRTYNNIAAMDQWVGQMIKELEDAGLLDKTVIVFFSDHGVGLPRGKRSCFDTGLRVPLIVRHPDGTPGSEDAGTRSDRVVSFIDFGPSVLSLAGIEPDKRLDGTPFLGDYARDRTGYQAGYAYANADRFDAAPDRARTISDGRFRYTRNYLPEEPYLIPVKYREQLPMTFDLYNLRNAGKVPAQQWQFGATRRPAEEFYDSLTDPWETNNLIDLPKPEQQERIATMRAKLDEWIKDTGDLGFVLPETEMVKQHIWPPDGEQPTTPKAEIRSIEVVESLKHYSSVTVTCEDPGASIGYRLSRDGGFSGPWLVYREAIGSVDRGYLLLVGVGKDDDQAAVNKLAKKVANLRLFPNEQGKFDKSLLDVGGGALVVSQFTLYGDGRKGNRPSFIEAAPPELASPLCDAFAEALRASGVQRVEAGRFGADMKVSLCNDGPVTLWLDSEV
eukprot:g13541.t1